MYNGIDIISIPRKSMSKVLKDEEIETPHKTKKIRAKKEGVSNHCPDFPPSREGF